MYYYGYQGGYNNCLAPYGGYTYQTTNTSSVAFILVLFILLVVVFGAGFVNYNN